MFRANLLRRRVLVRSAPHFFSSALAAAPQANPRADLDPTLRDLLNDVDISLGSKKRVLRGPHPPLKQELHEISAIPYDGPASIVQADEFEEPEESQRSRKSPAAEFGEYGLGAVVLPLELQKSIEIVIAGTDKRQLHNDAERLFKDTSSSSERSWDATYDVSYKTSAQSRQHGERDGSAFVSVALPAHFAAITAVLDHIKHRLEPEWRVERVLDWGAGTGSGLWSAAYAFQERHTPESQRDYADRVVSNTTLRQYVAMDKRSGLVTVGKRLVQNVDTGPLRTSWRKSMADEDTVPRSEGHYTVALSAFMLTTLSGPIARKSLVKEMWASGAHVLVIIDHNTTKGFEAISQAREFLLEAGKKESNDPEAESWDIRGSHVVAPCPHDRGCPLYHPGDIQLVCGFSQRLQRPSFVRKTKHSGDGQEDMGYSYVVIRRGARPQDPKTSVGRVGRVGQEALERELARWAEPRTRELFLHDEVVPEAAAATEPEAQELITEVPAAKETTDAEALDAAMRQEAYHWPRLIFPPLKKPGHIILDACTPTAQVMRMTVPKSQGKQPYYDARKSSWGDSFPHPPKNPPQVRYQPQSVNGRPRPTRFPDIGKRGGKDRGEDAKAITYGNLAKALRQERTRIKKVDSKRKRRTQQEFDEQQEFRED